MPEVPKANSICAIYDQSVVNHTIGAILQRVSAGGGEVGITASGDLAVHRVLTDADRVGDLRLLEAEEIWIVLSMDLSGD